MYRFRHDFVSLFWIIVLPLLCKFITPYSRSSFHKRYARKSIISMNSGIDDFPRFISTNTNDKTNYNQIERKSFKRFMEIELYRSPELDNMYPILLAIESACQDINRLMRRVTSDNLDGLQGTIGGTSGVNIQGEDQKKLDVIANRIMKSKLCCSGKVSIVASEEDDKPCLCSEVTDNSAFMGEYAAVFDPLDGSSNIDTGLPTGTIFGVYRNPKYAVIDPNNTVKQRGSTLVLAGYCLFSASCHLVLTLKTGVHQFTYDEYKGEFFLTRSNIKIPRQGNIYSFNDANVANWNSGIRYFLTDFKEKRISNLKGCTPSARYMGALVADCHNLLCNGGIFGYPGTLNKPAGKLRLLYECNPMALIFEEAGGAASNGNSRILDMNIDDIHQRTPFFLGSVDIVNALEKYNYFYEK